MLAPHSEKRIYQFYRWQVNDHLSAFGYAPPWPEIPEKNQYYRWAFREAAKDSRRWAAYFLERIV